MPVTTQNAVELTTEQVQRILIQPLESESRFLACGPRIFDTNGSPVRVPKLTGTFSPDWIGESELIPAEDDDIFGELKLLPSTMKSVKTLVRFSNELARQSVISLDAALRDRLVKDVAKKIDRQFFGSTGDGVTVPKGLLAQPGLQVIDTNGTLSLDLLHDAQAALLAANANVDGSKWVMRPEDFSDLRKLKDGGGKYLLEPDAKLGGKFVLLGSPVVITDSLIADNAVYADFSQIAVARDLNPSVTILKELFAQYDEIGIRVIARYDLGLLNPAAVVSLRNVV